LAIVGDAIRASIHDRDTRLLPIEAGLVC